MRFLSVAALLALGCLSAQAQVPRETQGSPGLPVVKLEFKAQPPIPGISASQVFSTPVLCSPEGTPFVDYPQPPFFMEHVIYSLDPKGAHSFSPKSAPGLYDVQFQSFYAGDSSVVFLVSATKDDKQSLTAESPLPGIPAPPVKKYIGEHHDYLVTFDRNGSYKSTAELPSRYHFWRIGLLPDGNLLALGFAPANSEARLLVLDSTGGILRTLQIPSKMAESPDLTQGESGPEVNRARAESSLSWWLFVPSRNRILLYQAHTNHPILEVGAGGAVREVPLEIPKGYALDGFVPANDRWIVRYRLKSALGAGASDASSESRNYVLYEADPSDGSLRRRIAPGAGSLFNLACEQDGVFAAFSMQDDKVIRRTADLPR